MEIDSATELQKLKIDANVPEVSNLDCMERRLLIGERHLMGLWKIIAVSML